MISSSGTSYLKKWNSSSAVAELAFRLSIICIGAISKIEKYIKNQKSETLLDIQIYNFYRLQKTNMKILQIL